MGNNNLPTREQVGENICTQVEYLLERGDSQTMTQEHYLRLVIPTLKGAGANDELLNRVVRELYQQLLESRF